MALFRMKPWYGKRVKELSYYGTAPNLSNKVAYFAATHIGDYALLAGGRISDNPPSTDSTNIINIYNKSLIKSTTNLANYKYCLAASHTDNYAIFAGGRKGFEFDGLNAVECYNTSFTRTYATTLTGIGRWDIGATHIGDYALFAGGQKGETWNDTLVNLQAVDAYNSSLTKTNIHNLSVARAITAATHVGNYVIFGGGGTSKYENGLITDVDIYDSSLTKLSTDNSQKLSLAAVYVATYVGNYAIFTGYKNSQGSINVFDDALTRTTYSNDCTLGFGTGATTVGDYAIFGGGYPYSSNYTQRTVYAFDKSLVKTYPTLLSTNRMSFSATHVGDYALFGGGINKTAGNNADPVLYSNTVDVYQVA